MLFDLIVIGSGPAGQKAAVSAAKAGKKVALVEEMSELGGGCVHNGTLPSKSFRESVYRWSMSSQGTLGSQAWFSTGSLEEASRPKTAARAVKLPDMARLMERCNRVVKTECAVVRDQLKRNGVSVHHGHGRLTSASDVEVVTKKGVEKLTASIIIIATGARPVAPKHLPVDGKWVLDSSSILTLKKIPRKLVVLGAGIIGCEYASMFATAGTQVTLVDRRHEILASVDREIVGRLAERFKTQKMEILLETEAKAIEKIKGGKGGVRVVLSSGRKLQADAVLIAQGRNGNTEDLGLDAAGVAYDQRGLITVDAAYRTSAPNIYAVGDVVGPPALASTSMEAGRIASSRAFGTPHADMPTLFPYGIYTIPEISMMGSTEEDLRDRKVDFVVGRANYREVARGQIVGDRWGLLKLLVERSTRKILGVHIIGDAASNLIHIGQAVMTLDGDLNYFIRTVFNYPTYAEAYKTAAFSALNELERPGKKPRA